MRNVAFTMLAVLLFCGCEGKEPGYESNPEAERAGRASAEAWLRLVDSGRYTESWQEMAGTFKKNIPQSAWQRYFSSLRKPLGRIVSRKMISCRYTKSIPGAPAGQYVVVKYSTFYEKKRNAVETVTPVLDTDGKWRVSGYFIE